MNTYDLANLLIDLNTWNGPSDEKQLLQGWFACCSYEHAHKCRPTARTKLFSLLRKLNENITGHSAPYLRLPIAQAATILLPGNSDEFQALVDAGAFARRS